MTYPEIGIYGATRVAWKEDPARALLLEIFISNPKKADKEIVTRFVEDALEDNKVLTAALETFATNALYRLRQGFPKLNPNIAALQAAKAQVYQDTKKRMILLGMIMPNGKTMRYCTGREMIEFGGWYAKIGKAVGLNKVVGQVLNEQEIWKLRGKHDHSGKSS